MQGIKIELIDSMGSDLTVANVARVSFNKWKEEFDQRDAKLIDYLAKHEHTSPFRHTAIQIRCKAPIFIARQLGKHQAGLSWNEVSRRYVDDNFEFFIPDGWRSRPADGIKQGSGSDTVDMVVEYGNQGKDGCRDLALEYKELVEASLQLYNDFVAKGVAPEQARMILPQSMLTEWVWTGNLFSFFHVYRLRIDAHAQKEVQEFAKQLDVICTELFPHSWGALKGNVENH